MLSMRSLKTKRLAALLSAACLFGQLESAAATPLQYVPSTAPFNEPSQEVATLNALIAYLNGLAGPLTNGVAPPVLSIGALGTASGATPQTCLGQRCSWAVTGISVTTTGSTQTLVENNAIITAASQCRAHFVSAFTAGSAVIPATVTASAGSLSIVIVNAGTTANAVTTGTLITNCDN
jgi:hypothetical protein